MDVRRKTLDQIPALDASIAGLISDLDERGLLDTTIVWVTSEFGRELNLN